MANIAYKYCLYPNKEQRTFFAKTFGCCRKVYNLMLSDKIKSYEATKSFGTQTPAMYKQDYPYLKEVDSLALANVQLHLQSAIKSCFDKTRKARNGFPKYKSAKHSRKSYTTNNQKGSVTLFTDGIKLPKVGKVKAVIHRKPDADWRLKSATVSQDRDGSYYVSVLFEYDPEIISSTIDMSKTIGLDYKSDGLFTDSNGNTAGGHKYYRESQKALAKHQRRLSRKVGARKGETMSGNYKKQQYRVAKLHRHIANQRLDYLHKLSTEIANHYDIVCVESLNMRAIANKGFGNGKATLDNGYGMFLNMLRYKLAARGKQLVEVDKWYPSSQICSCCGQRKKLLLSERTYRCHCGNTMDRDYNAARNIKNEGLRILLQTA
ncbi:MAG: RNA-guided endonuclease TnpB family protein [Eubacteriales bacterium]|nr:RNA-guided endonuclease TnpB family protein [Eubacteriales bacterium]